ncbi:MAG: hypothetical protein GX372_04155 [Ignavibacteria bacterium]|jgi:beta-glucosidase-like glycosyl hydrolase|nr:hypothetical protein [Ignavibacteria bacterium]
MVKFKTWTNEALAAQCIFPKLDCDKYLLELDYKEEIKELARLGVGGFCVFNGTTESARNVLSELQIFPQVPLLFCADFENGVTMRLEDGTDFPHAMALGKTGEFTGKVAKAIAKEAKDLGVLWNLAPVCDINSNPKNPIINIRAFGENSEVVSKNIVDYINFLQGENVMACAKHFPNHGDTKVDSHIEFPKIYKDYDELADEIIPFIAAINCGVKSIMVGHLFLEKIDDKYPASLSPKIICDILREKLNYKGIVVTDALDMKAITNSFKLEEIIKLAFLAGNDVLLMPENPLKAIEILSDIIKENDEHRTKIEISVDKIYNCKRWVKLIPQYAKETTTSVFIEHQKLALRAALQAVEIQNEGMENFLPISEEEDFAAFSILQRAEDLQAASRFFTMLAGASENDCDFAYLDENISEDEIEAMLENIENAKFLIFALFYRRRAYAKGVENIDKLNYIIDKLAAGREYVTILFGDPYIAEAIQSKLKIMTFSDSFPSLAAAIMKLTGRVLPDNY